ncbi:MAG: PDZ domain-containing protein [Candidatus Eisenbacteria bacterium]|uniref:PDZ domain-containing protein n=1 Tax=Eiseniibacteriota bacterium TaxID=2212470 RepID=A0A849SIN4_UNCEI|nr:PDZ domain-containing protein [Candidatus Eisenbacteria bacterium]
MSRLQSVASCVLALALVSSAASRPAHAEITPEARPVIEHYLQATGGLKALEYDRAVGMKGTLTAFGLTGTVELWRQRPGRTASFTTIGPLTLRDGQDATRSWRVDQNGKLQERDGKELEDSRASAWFDSEAWALPDQGGGRVTFAGNERDSIARYAVLEVTPPVGRARRLFFEATSGHLVRTVNRDDSRTMISHFSNFTRMANRLRARTTRIEVAEMPINIVTVTLDSVWVADAFPDERFAPPGEDASPVTFRGATGRVTVPFVYSTRHVWVKASLNGGPLEDFLLDTGAGVTVIDSAYAASRGLRSEGHIGVGGAGASGGGAFAQLDSLFVPGEGATSVRVGGQKVVILAVNPHLEPFFWRRCAGVLGYDFISRFVLEVDYDARRLVLHDPKHYQHTGAGEALTLELASNIPVVEGAIDSLYRGKFRLDVGSGSTVDLHTPFVNAHDLRQRAGRSVEVLGGGFGGTFSSTATRMKRMTLGSYGWDAPVVVLSSTDVGALASEDYAGNIGNRVLERFKVTFDYERRQVWLEPGARYRDRDRFSLTGLQLAHGGDGLTVAQVLAGSVAEAAGLRVGDRILDLEGRPAASWSIEEYERVFEVANPGEKRKLVYERDGKKRSIQFALRETL